MSTVARKTNYDRRGKQKVVLFFPTPAYGHYRIELGLALAVVAAPLEGKYDLHLVDERVTPNYEQAVLNHLDDTVCVGISSITGYQIKRGIAMARQIRAMDPEVPIVWGGYHPSLFPEQCCESEACDIVCAGQGDVTFREIVESLAAGRAPRDIPGAAYWTADGIVVNQPRPLTNINDVLPAPYHLLDVNRAIELNQKINHEKIRTTEFHSSQGCPGKCGYCADASLFQRRWFGLDAERVVAEVTDLVKTYRLDQVNFSDANFFANQKRVAAICRGFIESGLDIRWVASARPDTFHRYKQETLELIRDSGCKRIIVGAESAAEPVLELISKGATAEDHLKSAEVCRDYGIGGTFTFITGFPHPPGTPPQETTQDLLDFIQRLKHIHPDIRTKIFVFTPYPGTPLYDLSVQYGMPEPKSLEEWADYNPATMKESQWVEPWERQLIEKVNGFYFPFAYPDSTMQRSLKHGIKKWPYRIMHSLAKTRVNREFYWAPVEWELFKRFKKDTFEPIA
ncbi:MAG: B12-binding domain-containing radical SAM protein [Thermoleophilia bacterium]|nr:B12-binding domain-containing radical SAM protein [Thermoleophilia bacterium]